MKISRTLANGHTSLHVVLTYGTLAFSFSQKNYNLDRHPGASPARAARRPARPPRPGPPRCPRRRARAARRRGTTGSASSGGVPSRLEAACRGPASGAARPTSGTTARCPSRCRPLTELEARARMIAPVPLETFGGPSLSSLGLVRCYFLPRRLVM